MFSIIVISNLGSKALTGTISTHIALLTNLEIVCVVQAVVFDIMFSIF
jgi:hypothetical protein